MEHSKFVYVLFENMVNLTIDHSTIYNPIQYELRDESMNAFKYNICAPAEG